MTHQVHQDVDFVLLHESGNFGGSKIERGMPGVGNGAETRGESVFVDLVGVAGDGAAGFVEVLQGWKHEEACRMLPKVGRYEAEPQRAAAIEGLLGSGRRGQQWTGIKGVIFAMNGKQMMRVRVIDILIAMNQTAVA